MGVEGAAIATNIGRGGGVVYQLFFLIKGIGVVKIHKENFHYSWAIVRN